MSETLPEILSGDYGPSRRPPPRALRVVDWNIDRGLNFDGILNFLRMADADLVLLQEVDIHDRRTKSRNVADEIARSLQLNYVWAREFQELVQGTNQAPAYIGQATLSRWPIVNPRIIRFRSQSSFWQPHWFVPHVSPFQVRTGGRIALLCGIDLGPRNLIACNLHLESRNTDRLRMTQFTEVIKDAARFDSRVPVLIAGDFNMNTTHSAPAALIQHAGFTPVLAAPRPTTHLWFIAGPAIDWAFIRGPVQTSAVKVHSSIHDSDHFPITFQLTV